MTTPSTHSHAPANDGEIQAPSGTLPPPDVVSQYERVLPGAADRIMRMMESQAEHRMEMERSLVDGAVRTERLGQIFGLSVVLLAFLVSAWLIVNDHSVSGTVLGVTDLIVLVVVFAQRDSSGHHDNPG